jgi:hypothetical protein
MQRVPTKWHYKEVPAICGQTSIRGDMVLCDACERAGVDNPPAYTYEDAGELDFEPYRESDYY